MLGAEHWKANIPVGEGCNFRAQSIDLVAEQEADREIRLPVEDVDALWRGFDGGDLVAAGSQVMNDRDGIPGVFPRDRFLGAERGLRDGFFGRTAGDAAQTQFFDASGVGGSEEGSDVVEAANVIEHDGYGQRGDAFIRGGLRGCPIGDTFQVL